MAPWMNIRGGAPFILKNSSVTMAFAISTIMYKNYLLLKDMSVTYTVTDSCTLLIPLTDHVFLEKTEISDCLVKNGTELDSIGAVPPLFTALARYDGGGTTNWR